MRVFSFCITPILTLCLCRLSGTPMILMASILGSRPSRSPLQGSLLQRSCVQSSPHKPSFQRIPWVIVWCVGIMISRQFCSHRRLHPSPLHFGPRRDELRRDETRRDEHVSTDPRLHVCRAFRTDGAFNQFPGGLCGVLEL